MYFEGKLSRYFEVKYNEKSASCVFNFGLYSHEDINVINSIASYYGITYFGTLVSLVEMICFRIVSPVSNPFVSYLKFQSEDGNFKELEIQLLLL